MHVAEHRHAVEPDGALVDVVARAGHLVPQTTLGNHVGLLPTVHLVRREADGRAGEGAQLAVAAVDALEAVLLAHLAVHHANVEGHGDAGARVEAGARAAVCGRGRVGLGFKVLFRKVHFVNYYFFMLLKVNKINYLGLSQI